MTGENKTLSDRQVFRTGVLENIAPAMLLAPYAAVRLAGAFHMLALFAGIIFAALYGAYIYFVSSRVCGSYEMALLDFGKMSGRIVGGVYYLRFLLKASLFVLFLGETVTAYMLPDTNKWLVITAFALVCIYGASRSVTGRARLLEMLFLWLVVPVILLAVFSISSVSVRENPDFIIRSLAGISYDEGWGIIAGGYGLLFLLSGMELMLFTLSHAGEGKKQSLTKVVIWICISVFMAYIFIMGILGRSWVLAEPAAVLNAMEAAVFPGNALNRADYLILAFLLIGVFAAVSGYLFCATAISRSEGSRRTIILSVVFFIMMGLWNIRSLGRLLFMYLFFGDFAVGIVLSLIIYRRAKRISEKFGATQ